jgi:hypothetical protein
MAMSILRRAAFPDHDCKMKNWKDRASRGPSTSTHGTPYGNLNDR